MGEIKLVKNLYPVVDKATTAQYRIAREIDKEIGELSEEMKVGKVALVNYLLAEALKMTVLEV